MLNRRQILPDWGQLDGGATAEKAVAWGELTKALSLFRQKKSWDFAWDFAWDFDGKGEEVL